MQSLATHDLSGLDVAETTIRQLVKTTGFPVSRLLIIAREAMAQQPAPREVWEIAELQGEEAKPLIEARCGPSLTTEQTAEGLGVSDQTVRNIVERGQLIAYSALRGKGLKFPAFQFTQGDGNKLVVHTWVTPLIKYSGGHGWGLLDFLTVPRLDRNGLNYLAMLRGEQSSQEEVLAAARRSNPD